MSDQHQSEATRRLSPDMTLDEALNCAMEFEQTARQFYLELARRVEPDAQPLVLDLAAEEARHHDLLAQLARDPELAATLQSVVNPPPSRERFHAYVTLPVLADLGDADDLLNYAEARELIAQEHYGHLAELAQPGALQDLFRYLHNEERQHSLRIQSRWSSLFAVP